MTDYWPWWAGALGLGVPTFAFRHFVGKKLGLSGTWERVLHTPTELEAERADAVLDDMAAFDAGLAAETAAMFGGDTGSGSVATLAPAADSSSHSHDGHAGAAAVPVERRLPLSTQYLLLASVLFGGVLAALVSGRFEWRADMGDAFSAIVVDGWGMWPVLFGGGILVGIGTRMAGGCNSGHGLSGCSRLEPLSLVATAIFFGSAVGMSFLVWKVI